MSSSSRMLSVLSALSPAVTPAEVTGEAAQLKGHISAVGCVPSLSCSSLSSPAQPSRASSAQSDPRAGSARQPRPPARQRHGPADAAAKIRATKVLTWPSLATLPGRLCLSLPAPGVGGEAEKSSQMRSVRLTGGFGSWDGVWGAAGILRQGVSPGSSTKSHRIGCRSPGTRISKVHMGFFFDFLNGFMAQAPSMEKVRCCSSGTMRSSCQKGKDRGSNLGKQLEKTP